jgi:hypothetical protein
MPLVRLVLIRRPRQINCGRVEQPHLRSSWDRGQHYQLLDPEVHLTAATFDPSRHFQPAFNCLVHLGQEPDGIRPSLIIAFGAFQSSARGLECFIQTLLPHVGQRLSFVLLTALHLIANGLQYMAFVVPRESISPNSKAVCDGPLASAAGNQKPINDSFLRMLADRAALLLRDSAGLCHHTSSPDTSQTDAFMARHRHDMNMLTAFTPESTAAFDASLSETPREHQSNLWKTRVDQNDNELAASKKSPGHIRNG